MNVVVVGYGSIGERHTRILSELGQRVAVISRRNIDYPCLYATVAEALISEQPQYIVIANKTADHYQTLQEIEAAGYNGTVLVEKPLYMLDPGRYHSFSFPVYVAYNLRFHPLLMRLKHYLDCQRIISVHIYVGQYLPTWRPNQDYRSGYSARRAEGGGVLRDLSHELDYAAWIFGDWLRLTALGGKFSDLEIDSEDVTSIQMVTAKCPVATIQLNYLDRVVRREILVNTSTSTVFIDLVNGIMKIDDKTELVKVARDDTYRNQHLSLLSGDTSQLCTYGEGLQVIQMIDAVEQAIRQKRWIER